MKNMVICFYSHPEYYPPTLNALSYLAADYDNIYVVHRNYPSSGWKFPPNVHLIANGPVQPIKEVENAGTLTKIRLFLRFARLLRKHIRKANPDTILLYDSIAVLAYRLSAPFVRKPRVLWYHNHDVTDLSAVKKHSIGGWSVNAEKWIFPLLNIFTLPADSRKKYFPMDRLKGQYFLLPNFPSQRLYGKYLQTDKKIEKTINLVFQGYLGPQHGLEEIITYLLPQKQEYIYRLHLKGFISPSFRSELEELSRKYNVEEQVTFYGFIPYADIPASNAENHIGIAIYKKKDIMNTTMSTASNKIYEYAASGMPALLYDNEHFRQHVGKFRWALFTDCSASSLVECMKDIVANYALYNSLAKKDFLESLNYEKNFLPLAGILKAEA